MILQIDQTFLPIRFLFRNFLIKKDGIFLTEVVQKSFWNPKFDFDLSGAKYHMKGSLFKGMTLETGAELILKTAKTSKLTETDIDFWGSIYKVRSRNGVVLLDEEENLLGKMTYHCEARWLTDTMEGEFRDDVDIALAVFVMFMAQQAWMGLPSWRP